MNEQVKKMWVEALNNTQYGQIKGHLAAFREEYSPVNYKGPNCFCALGLLCELHRETTNQGWWVFNISHQRWAYRSGTDAADSCATVAVLPPCVQVWAGLSEADPEVRDEDGERATITRLNDDPTYGCTFKTIAKMVDASL